jgi:cell wall-associated NlpC family hydrolase
MARSLTPARTAHRAVVALALTCGLAAVPFPAAAEPAPATSREAAALIADRAHELEVLTERFNTTREELAATRRAAASAAEELSAARTALSQARDRVRTVARSAWTGNRLRPLQAMLTSGSRAEMLDRLGTLQTIAEHNDAVLGTAEEATADADRAQEAAQRVARDAQAQVDRVAVQQKDLDAQIAVYQAEYDRLTAREARASRAAAERRAAQRPTAQQTPTAPMAGGSTSPAPAASAPATPVPPPAPVSGGSGAAQIAVSTAMAQLGDPYVWGAAGPDAFDCSGLVQYSYAAAGISLPHSSSMQSTMGTPVSRSALQPGDLVFFYSPVSHVGIYIGNGQMVHASTSGSPVKTASIDDMGSYNSARRIAG